MYRKINHAYWSLPYVKLCASPKYVLPFTGHCFIFRYQSQKSTDHMKPTCCVGVQGQVRPPRARRLRQQHAVKLSSHTRPTESEVTAGAGSGEQSSMVMCNWLIIWLWPFKRILNSNRLNSNTWLAKPHFSLGSSSGHSWLSNEDPIINRSLAKLVTLWQIKFTSATCSQRPPTCLQNQVSTFVSISISFVCLS